MARRRIVLVEDESSISEPLSAALEREGFQVDVAPSGEEGIEAARRLAPDLVLLDLGLPDIDGRDVCRAIRERSRVPIIMLTARGMETDRVVGLELGADDYVVKPFSAAELAARIRAVLRRAAPPQVRPEGELKVGDITLDLRTWSASSAGKGLDLAKREFEVLKMLMENAGSVVTRERMIEELWDPNWFGSTKTLDVHIGSLRKKLGDDPEAPRYIHTIRGVGFRFASDEELALA